MPSITVTHDLLVPAPPERVWSEIVDLQHWSAWNVNHVDFGEEVPTLGPQERFRQSLQVRGAPGEVSWFVEALEAPSVLALAGKGPLAIRFAYAFTVEPEGDGSRLESSLSLSALALAPMLKAIRRELEKDVPTSLEKLRDRIVEQPVATA